MVRDQALDGSVPRVEMDPRAEEWLDSLRDLGYLPATLEAEVLDRLTVRLDGVAGVDDVRRIAAEVFFERMMEPEIMGFGLLEEEWKAVFS